MKEKTILGHPIGLFILFFTEMWERFSYYGMRAILVFFLVDTALEQGGGGFGWTRAEALVLYAWYTGFVYLTPLIGGYLADKKLGYRNAVVLGAALMTLGHGVLALETPAAFYAGLIFLVIGNGFFKPNISSIVGQLYPEGSEKKDSGYTIFYMGVNAGAFLGMMICGWLGETKGWSYGFGAAGVFMLFGLLQFWFAQNIFGKIGLKPKKQLDAAKEQASTENIVPFTKGDKNGLITSIVLLIATVFAFKFIPLPAEKEMLRYLFVLPFLVAIISYILKRLGKYPKVEKDRLSVIAILAIFSVFFWMAFEQAGGTMSIFAKDYTNRSLSTPLAVDTFRYVSLALTLIPILILSWVLISMARKIVRSYPLTILFSAISFLIIWGIVYQINLENFSMSSNEIPASWFGILNGLFIISFAPLFSKLWVKLTGINKNPSGPIKFALGLFLLGLGFLALSLGSASIPKGAETASVSIIWLILAYLFHTLGELCLSPVGLSFINKLSPARLVGMMFGVWFLGNFVANFAGGIIGSYIDEISQNSSLSGFFSIFVVSSFAAALALVLLNKKLKKMMHGVV